MEVLLDPSIELLGAADLLGAGAGAPVSPPLKSYVLAVRAACEPHRSHPAVALNAARDAADPSFFTRRDLLLKRGPPPGLTRDACWNSEASDAERGGEWEPWLEAMRDFARATTFDRVFAAATPLLAPDLDGLRRHVAAADYVGKIERYTGLAYRGRYRLMLSPLCARGGGLNRVWTRDDGRREIISVLTPDRKTSADRAFGDRGMDAVVWHELCHGLLDMTVDLYDHDEKDTPLELGLGHNCRNWLHGIREHLVRAVMLRLIALESGEEESALQFDREEFKARPHLAAFVELLRVYEASRAAYPTLADFYPRLREAFPRPSGPRPPVTAGPFATPAQRALALEHLELLLRRSKDENLIRRREALSRVSETATEPKSAPARTPGEPSAKARAARGSGRTRSKPTRASDRPSKPR